MNDQECRATPVHNLLRRQIQTSQATQKKKSTYSTTTFTFIKQQYKETGESPLSAHLTSQIMIQNGLILPNKNIEKHSVEEHSF